MSKRIIIQSTQVMIAFQIDGDGEQDVKDLLKMLIQVGLLIWRFWQGVSRKKRQFKDFWLDCQVAAAGVTFSEILNRAAKPLTIGFNSVTFGVG